MKRLIVIVLFLLPLLAHAQYKCTINGKSVYSDQPCARDARHVGVAHDRVPEQRVEEARRRADAEQREVAAIKAAEAKADEVRAQVEAERRAAAASAVDKCAEAREELARLREPMVTHIWWHPIDPSGRRENERLAKIGEAERKVFKSCR